MALDVESTNYRDLLGKLLETNSLQINEDLKISLPRKGGVYRIIKNGSDATLYVGQSTNLRSWSSGTFLTIILAILAAKDK